MTTTLTVLQQRALRELDCGFIVPNADISAVAASSFTAARFFQNTNLAADILQRKEAGAVRAGAATAADFYRPLGTLANSTGVVAQIGPTWADTTVGSEEIEVWYYGVRRDQEVLASLNRVMEFKFATIHLGVSHLSRYDGDMLVSTDTLWTDVGTPVTSAKTSLSPGGQIIPWGPRAYRLTNDAANEGTRSSGIVVTQGRQVSAFAIAAADVGTASFQLYDGTNSAAFGTAVTHSERRPQLMVQTQQSVPATAKIVHTYNLGTTTTSDIYWNQVWLYNLDNLTCPLPSSLSESFHAPKLLVGIPRTSTGTNTYDAGSLDFQPLREGVDYWLIIDHVSAEPYKVRFADSSLYQYPVFVEARLPLSTFTTFSAETDVAYNPLHEILPAFKKDLLETVYNTGSRRHPDWNVQHNLAIEQMTKASKARPFISVGPERPSWTPRLSAY